MIKMIKMNKLNSDLINNIQIYLEPKYICILKKNTDIASFASVCKYIFNTRQKLHPQIYKDKCKIVFKIKKICQTHCKAYPILTIIHNKSKYSIKNKLQYMHFKTKYIAQFAPYLLKNINFIKTCCDGKGWDFKLKH